METVTRPNCTTWNIQKAQRAKSFKFSVQREKKTNQPTNQPTSKESQAQNAEKKEEEKQ